MARQLLSADPHSNAVTHVTFVPFMPGGEVALLPAPQNGSLLPSGALVPGEHYLDAALRIPLEVAGYRMQRVHPFAIDGSHLYVWLEGDRYRGSRPHRDVDLVVDTPEGTVRQLRTAGWEDEAAVVEEAVQSFQTQTEDSYYADNVRLLERAYLAASTPQGGSGFGGDSARWRARRRHIADAIDRDGTFLDIGCANGLLMESMVEWAADRGFRIEPHGIDTGPGLIDLARRRVPQWSDRLWVGNAIEWKAPDRRRFDYVHVLLDVVPQQRISDMLRHLLEHVVAPGGRLLVSQYAGDGGTLPSAGETLRRLGFEVSGETFPAEEEHRGSASLAWIERRPTMQSEP